MNYIYKIFLTTIVTLLGAVIAWFIPDGLNLLYPLIDKEPIIIAELSRFWSASFGAMIVFFFKIFIWFKDEITLSTNKLNKDVVYAIDSSLNQSINKSLIPIFFNSLSMKTPLFSTIINVLESLIVTLSKQNHKLIIANSISLKNMLSEAENNIVKLNHEGIFVNLDTHIKTTRVLIPESKKYTQIQKNILDASQDWTDDWIELLNYISEYSIESNYIILSTMDNINNNREKMNTMKNILQKNGFVLKYCYKEKVKDSLGKEFFSYDAIEIFDTSIIKTQKISKGEYKGGKALMMSLLEYKNEINISKFIHRVEKSSIVWK